MEFDKNIYIYIHIVNTKRMHIRYMEMYKHNKVPWKTSKRCQIYTHNSSAWIPHFQPTTTTHMTTIRKRKTTKDEPKEKIEWNRREKKLYRTNDIVSFRNPRTLFFSSFSSHTRLSSFSIYGSQRLSLCVRHHVIFIYFYWVFWLVSHTDDIHTRWFIPVFVVSWPSQYNI